MACAQEAKCAPFVLASEFDDDVSRCKVWASNYCRLEIEADGSNVTVGWVADQNAKLSWSRPRGRAG